MYRSATLSRRAGVVTATAALIAGLTLAPAVAANAGGHGSGGHGGHGNSCEKRNNNTYAKLLDCVTVKGVMQHQAAFQRIADTNDGNRAAGTTGYTKSVEYVAKTLKKAGWKVTLDEFDYTYFPPAELQQLSPTVATYETGTFTGSATGDVTANVVPVDVALTPPRDSTSGCEAADFAGFPVGSIALVQRGTCTFAVKALNAQAAGASAVVIFNQGNTPDREGLIIGTLDPEVADIPVVGASFADGAALAQPGSTARILVEAAEERPQVNVIAELPGRNKDNVVMAGAHLDSVQQGPGINDNGNGSAALLEVAQNLGNHKPQNTLRFAWWGAEEDGLLGSAAYVAGLAPTELDKIALYLNFDMVASPNYIYMVYDGDESSFPAPVVVPEGSVQIEDLFESFFTKKKLPYDDAEFSGRSDYEAFILNGIPAGGLFTGAEVVKSEEQAAIWGGTAGEAFDPCYHQACDTIDNLSLKALSVNSDAIAFAALTYAYSTESVNGVKGKKVPGRFSIPTPAGPEGTVGGGGGHEHRGTE